MTRQCKDSDSSTGSSEPTLASLLRRVARESADPEPPLLPQPGATIADKYRIEARLGRGGMGAVYRATHLLTQKSVALKWMLHPSSNVRSRSRFIREARAASRVDHPNVVNVYDVGQEDSGWYLVMELLLGEPLSARIARGPITVEETVDILLPAMHGVAAVHQAGVIHRDLKPDNIFLCHVPNAGDPLRPHAKVLDFGISAFDSIDGCETTLTEEGSLLGTPAYMSPEQVRSPRNLDVRADIYALGVILYEMLTGRRPFETDSYSGLVLAIVHDEPTPLRSHRQDVPPALEAVVLRALSKSKEERQPNIATLIAEVAPFGSRPQPVALTSRTHARALESWHLVLIAILVALAAAGGIWHVTQNVDAPPPTVPPARPSPTIDLVPPSIDAPNVDVPGVDPLQPIKPHPIVEPAPITPSPSEATDTTDRKSLPRQVPRPSQPEKRAHPNKEEVTPACDPPYFLDSSGRTIFKLECI